MTTQLDKIKNMIAERKSEIARPDNKVIGTLMYGNLKGLTDSEKVSYYMSVCDRVGLNPLTQPFQFIVLNGKETLYAGKNCCEQLRQVHNISITIVSRELVDDLYIVTARAKNLSTGREDESIGAVTIGNLKGDAKCNAIMKAETKAKRRVTLSICGLGMLDETEIETIPNAQPAQVNVVDEWKKKMDYVAKEFNVSMDTLRDLYKEVRAEGFSNGHVEEEMRKRLHKLRNNGKTQSINTTEVTYEERDGGRHSGSDTEVPAYSARHSTNTDQHSRYCI